MPLILVLLALLLGTPKTTVNPTSLVVPVGEQRVARWTGGQPPGIQLSNPDLCEAWIEGSKLVVRGLRSGDGTVTLVFPDRALDLQVKVRRPAAQFPSSLSVSLTGSAVGPEVLQQAVDAALSAAPGATLSYTQRGEWLDVSASGPGLLPASAKIKLDVTLQQMPFTPARTLVVSNRPELVAYPGVLLQRPLPTGPSRVLIHHRGDPESAPTDLEVTLKNVNAVPARVRVALAMLGPSQDEIYVGHVAAQRLINLQQKGQSYILRIPPGQEVALDRRLLKSGQTVSGMGWIEPLDGAQVQLAVRTLEPGTTERPTADVPEIRQNRTARGLFPPAVDLAHAHHAGGPFTFIPLGEEPYEKDPQTGESNFGNFGMVYRVKVRLSNPTDRPRKTWIDFVPRAGPARGSLFVDGVRVETDMGTHAEEIKLGEWEIAPGEERDVRIETFPQSGSNYPVFLVVKSEYGDGRVPKPPAPAPEPAESQFIF